MPMYDYRCDRCGTQFEVRQSFTDDALKVCPSRDGPTACTAPGQGPVKKVFTGVGILFKGDGFYKNDHGSNASGRKKDREAASVSDVSSPDSSSDSGSGSGSTSSESTPSKPAGSESTDTKTTRSKSPIPQPASS